MGKNSQVLPEEKQTDEAGGAPPQQDTATNESLVTPDQPSETAVSAEQSDPAVTDEPNAEPEQPSEDGVAETTPGEAIEPDSSAAPEVEPEAAPEVKPEAEPEAEPEVEPEVEPEAEPASEPKDDSGGDVASTAAPHDEAQSAATPAGVDMQPIAAKKSWLSKKTMSLLAILCAVLLAAAALFLLTRDSGNDTAQPSASTTKKESRESRITLGAALTYAEGTVEHSSGGSWENAQEGATFGEGDELRTGQDSRAIITLDDGSAIRLNQNTKVVLDTLLTDSVVVTNGEGAVYARVVASKNRTFAVKTADMSYTALGTAYLTTNTADKKGVEVFHSQVKAGETVVKEGQGLYELSSSEAVKKVVSLDPEKLRQDAFVTWNKAQDEKSDEFKEKLGFLKNIDKAPEPQPTPAQPPQQPANPGSSISASASAVGDGIQVNWSLNNVSADYAFKVVYSKTDTTPTYGENSARYVAKGNYSTKLSLTDGKTWHIRVCSYRGNGQCLYYSNTVTVQAPYVEKEKVSRGTMSASLSGSVLNWSYTGRAPYGYKVVWNTSGAPTYPPSGSHAGARLVTSGTSFDLNSKIQTPGLYKVRVCAYTSGTEPEACVDYSPEVVFVRR
ncbi:hypothetical protein CSA80_01515 [Candidatus Saccharibacteria bacterium]|nr:MAG: hypothetical protein CSA80_01515 [Candidatus Saccharibacteria bacterium]